MCLRRSSGRGRRHRGGRRRWSWRVGGVVVVGGCVVVVGGCVVVVAGRGRVVGTVRGDVLTGAVDCGGRVVDGGVVVPVASWWAPRWSAGRSSADRRRRVGGRRLGGRPAVDSVTGATAAVLVAVGTVVLVDVDEPVTLAGHAGTAIVVVLVDGAASASSVASPVAASAPAASVSSAADVTPRADGDGRRRARRRRTARSARRARGSARSTNRSTPGHRARSSFGGGRPPAPMLPPSSRAARGVVAGVALSSRDGRLCTWISSSCSVSTSTGWSPTTPDGFVRS